MGVYEGHDCTFKVEGKHVHSFGPVKNWVECCIKVSFYPTENEGKYNNDGYSYECLYKSYFWGSYYTTDFDALLNRLLDAMIDYFDYHESSHYSEKDGETMRLGFYKNQRAGSIYL